MVDLIRCVVLASCRCVALALCLSACGSSAAQALITDGVPAKLETPENAERYVLSGASTKVEVEINGAVSYTLTFPDVSGDLFLATDDPEKSIATVIINMKSGTTSNKNLEDIAKSEDFLDVEKYPKAVFEVRGLTKNKDEGNTYQMLGVLDLHGTTKAVTVPTFRFSVDQCRALASTEFSINRRVFGVESDTFLDGMASDDVDIRVQIQLTRRTAPATCAAAAAPTK